MDAVGERERGYDPATFSWPGGEAISHDLVFSVGRPQSGLQHRDKGLSTMQRPLALPSHLSDELAFVRPTFLVHCPHASSRCHFDCLGRRCNRSRSGSSAMAMQPKSDHGGHRNFHHGSQGGSSTPSEAAVVLDTHKPLLSLAEPRAK